MPKEIKLSKLVMGHWVLEVGNREKISQNIANENRKAENSRAIETTYCSLEDLISQFSYETWMNYDSKQLLCNPFIPLENCM